MNNELKQTYCAHFQVHNFLGVITGMGLHDLMLKKHIIFLIVRLQYVLVLF